MTICNQCHEDKVVIVEGTGICSTCEFYNNYPDAKEALDNAERERERAIRRNN